MSEFECLFDADARMTENFDDRPLPESGVLGCRDVDGLAAALVADTDVRASPEPDASFIGPAPQPLVYTAVDGDDCSAGSTSSLFQERVEMAVPILHVLHENAQQVSAYSRKCSGRYG